MWVTCKIRKYHDHLMLYSNLKHAMAVLLVSAASFPAYVQLPADKSL